VKDIYEPKQYWAPKFQLLIEQYVTAGSKADKDKIYTQLYPAIDATIIKASASLPFNFFIQNDEELFSDVRIHIYTKILSKITPDKLTTAQSYIYKTARNRIITVLRIRKEKRKIEIDNEVDISTLDLYNDEPVDIQYIRRQIITEMEHKVMLATKQRKKKVILFLLLIKQYLIDNQFDERGCADYVCRMLRIKEATFRKIAYDYGIKAFLFLKAKQE
jgi:DNA-directed RNA polymerase specialized sigma24 family protein